MKTYRGRRIIESSSSEESDTERKVKETRVTEKSFDDTPKRLLRKRPPQSGVGHNESSRSQVSDEEYASDDDGAILIL